MFLNVGAKTRLHCSPKYRKRFSELIEAHGDIQIVGEAKTGREAVQMAKNIRPEVIVMDIAMPLMNGLQATRQILNDVPSAKVLILSAHSDPEYIDQMVKIGAMGYRRHFNLVQ